MDNSFISIGFVLGAFFTAVAAYFFSDHPAVERFKTKMAYQDKFNEVPNDQNAKVNVEDTLQSVEDGLDELSQMVEKRKGNAKT